MKTFFNYIAQRLAERSTWLGLIGALTTIGLSISPEFQEAIIAGGVGLASAVAIITKDKTSQ